MMLFRSLKLATVCFVLASTAQHVSGQHCAPIVESYLNRVAVSREADVLEFQLSYSKAGGQAKASYQAYLLVFDANVEDKVLKVGAAAAIEQKLVKIVGTQVIRRNQKGSYPFSWTVNQQQLVKQLIAGSILNPERKSLLGTGGVTTRSFDLLCSSPSWKTENTRRQKSFRKIAMSATIRICRH